MWVLPAIPALTFALTLQPAKGAKSAGTRVCLTRAKHKFLGVAQELGASWLEGMDAACDWLRGGGLLAMELYMLDGAKWLASARWHAWACEWHSAAERRAACGARPSCQALENRLVSRHS